MRIVGLLILVIFMGCGSGDPGAPGVGLEYEFLLSDAVGADYPVTRVVVMMSSEAKTGREVELVIGADSAVGSISGLETGHWMLEAAVYSSRLLLAEGEMELEVVEGTSAVPLDFIDWDNLFPELPRRILFIGHSHTLANGGLDVHFANMVNAFDSRWDVTAAKVATGGWGLDVHWNAPNSEARNTIETSIWDAVVLHGSIALLEDHATYNTYAGRFSNLIRSEGADPWLIMNWAPPEMLNLTPEIVTRVDYTSRATNTPVSPLGSAWQNILNNHPDINLFIDSAGHPTPQGTQLAVSTLFASLIGISPEPGSYTVDDSVTPSELAIIQSTGWNTVSR